MIIFTQIFIYLVPVKKEISKATGIDVSSLSSSCQCWLHVRNPEVCLKISDIWALPQTNSFRISGGESIHPGILKTPRYFNAPPKLRIAESMAMNMKKEK